MNDDLFWLAVTQRLPGILQRLSKALMRVLRGSALMGNGAMSFLRYRGRMRAQNLDSCFSLVALDSLSSASSVRRAVSGSSRTAAAN